MEYKRAYNKIDEKKSIFSQRLKELRINRNQAQEELAHQLKTHRNAIYRLENDNNTEEPIFVKIAKHYDVSLDYLFGLTDVMDSYKRTDDKEKIDEILQILNQKKDNLIKNENK